MKNNNLPNLQRSGSGWDEVHDTEKPPVKTDWEDVINSRSVKPKQKLSELSIADLIIMYDRFGRYRPIEQPLSDFQAEKNKILKEIKKRIDNIDWDN
jgi:hypothetical protein